MRPPDVGVTSSGAIQLGKEVVCDGFVSETVARVQSHVHSDHMQGFESSKRQRILTTPGTRLLLINERDADLPYRSNLIPVAVYQPYTLPSGTRVELFPSNHMLGSVQVVAEYADGFRAAYSGDFGWPLERVPEVDVLVVDATCAQRNYSRNDAELRFVELLVSRLRAGPVSIQAQLGTLERVLELVAQVADVPVIASREVCALAVLFRECGYDMPDLIDSSSEEGIRARRSGRYVVAASGFHRQLTGEDRGSSIMVSAFAANPDDPVQRYTSTAFRVALSCHATFSETLQYIAATKASVVITDNSRGNHAIELAWAVKERLGVVTFADALVPNQEWGK